MSNVIKVIGGSIALGLLMFTILVVGIVASTQPGSQDKFIVQFMQREGKTDAEIRHALSLPRLPDINLETVRFTDGQQLWVSDDCRVAIVFTFTEDQSPTGEEIFNYTGQKGM